MAQGNQIALKMATSPVFHKLSKQIDTKNQFIRDMFEDKAIKLMYTPRIEIGAHIVTKPIPQPKVELHSKALPGQRFESEYWNLNLIYHF